jgi:hypothetical protein
LKRMALEKKPPMDTKAFETNIHELYSILIRLNANFQDLFKKNTLKMANKKTFTDVLTQLLMCYDPNVVNFSLTDEDILKMFRNIGKNILPKDILT